MVRPKKTETTDVKVEKKADDVTAPKTPVKDAKTAPETDTPKEDTGSKETKKAPTDQSGQEDDVRILFSAQCKKLSARGQGELQYEIGLIKNTDDVVVRIVSSGSSGAFSKFWIELKQIRDKLETVKGENFRAIIFQELYKRKSANNHGYLGAVLKHLGVIASEPEQPTVLYFESWDPLMKKIELLKIDKDSSA